MSSTLTQADGHDKAPAYQCSCLERANPTGAGLAIALRTLGRSSRTPSLPFACASASIAAHS